MSCCRKSAFSAMSSALLLARSASVPRGKEDQALLSPNLENSSSREVTLDNRELSRTRTSSHPPPAIAVLRGSCIERMDQIRERSNAHSSMSTERHPKSSTYSLTKLEGRPLINAASCEQRVWIGAHRSSSDGSARMPPFSGIPARLELNALLPEGFSDLDGL